MPVIVVVNLKGGVGKSTIALNLACEISTRKKQTVLIDADDQGTSTKWAQSGLLPITCISMPLESPKDVQSWLRRVQALKAEWIVIDCPPRLAAATGAAVGLADLALVPIGASGADLDATSSALALIGQAKETRKDRGPRCILVPSRIDRRTASGREIWDVLRGLGELVGPAIHQRAAMVDAFSAGMWIGQYAPNSDSYADIKALTSLTLRK